MPTYTWCSFTSKRVRLLQPIKCLLLKGFYLYITVEGHCEHCCDTTTRRESICYITLITQWKHDWCEYIVDICIFNFHFNQFSAIMVAVMLKSFTIFWEVDFFFTSMAALPCVSELKSCFVVYNFTGSQLWWIIVVIYVGVNNCLLSSIWFQIVLLYVSFVYECISILWLLKKKYLVFFLWPSLQKKNE